MEWWVAAGVFVLAAAAGFLGVRAFRSGQAGPGPVATVGDGRVVVVLDVARGDPESPAVRRLVHDAAVRAFASMPEATDVEVRSVSAEILGRVARDVAVAPPVQVPNDLVEPHLRRAHSPDPTLHVHEGEGLDPAQPGAPSAAPLPPEPHRPVAERFDLPATIVIRDPEDAVDLVRAILEAGGHLAYVQGDLITVRDLVVAVIPEPRGAVVDRDALNLAFHRISRARAVRGLVVAFGLLDPSDVRRREMLAPNVLHAGVDGVQRMADAVALGADPLRFVLAPALSSS